MTEPKSETRKIVKTEKTLIFKANKIFKKRYQKLLQPYVLRTQDIFERASILLKYHILKLYDSIFIDDEINLNRLDQFEQLVPFQQICETPFTVVTTDFSKKIRGRPPDAGRIAFMESLEESYQELVTQNLMPKEKCDGKNLSHVLMFSKVQLKTAYSNNIKCHFRKYIRRIIKHKVRSIFVATTGKDQFTKEERNNQNRITNALLKVILTGDDISRVFDEVDFKSILDDFKLEYPLTNDWSVKVMTKPFYFLPFMIKMNRIFERNELKQYSPLPFRSDFIPKSMCISYVALCDMFITKDNIDHLKEHLSAYGWKLPDKFNKGGFYKVGCLDTKTYMGSNEYKQALFRTHVWSYFTKSLMFRHHNDLVFSNIVTTNGYQTSVHYTDKASFQNPRFQKNVYVVRDKELDDNLRFPYAQSLHCQHRRNILNSSDPKLFCDPGKSRIVTIGTGGKDGKYITYTKRQRARETYQKRNSEELSRLLDTKHASGNTYRQIQASITTSGKSSLVSTFTTYLHQRREVQSVLKDFYEKVCHRRRKLRTYIGQQKSVDKLIHKIDSTFNPTNETKPIIFWGNWGRNPNLKNNAPSPGIGLKRLFGRRFRIYTCDERGSSSRCPSCESDLEYPLSRIAAEEDRTSGEMVERQKHIHHVLRCKNVDCSMWWDRDILAVNNQKKQVMYNLREGAFHPIFSRTVRPTIALSDTY